MIRTAGVARLAGTVVLTLAADLGGMDALIAAAQAEGSLNLIGLPRD